MVNIDTWMEGFLSRLKETFGPRLLFLGLQGSYGRGEANEDSDIDVVCVPVSYTHLTLPTIGG